jgi:ribonucleotide reductase beta subunit family protein with ferritin-like domain
MTNRLSEPLLIEDNSRFSQLPYRFPELQKAYEAHEAAFWTAKEIDYAADVNDWKSLNDDERYFIEHILAFFAGADGIVLENLVTNFCEEVKAPEARNFYGFQAAIENIHAQVYALLIDTYVKQPDRKMQLFNAIDTIPCVGRKAQWAIKWISKDTLFEERIIAFAVVEGVFFSGSFCAIFWLKSRGKMVKALGTSNELIARDEGLHTDFAVLMYKHLKNKVSHERVEEIFREAVEIEKEFICTSLPCRLIGMNSELMCKYIEFVADRLLTQLGFEKIYNPVGGNPFDFMEHLSIDGKTNFFEKRVTEYKLGNAATSQADWEINEDEDF